MSAIQFQPQRARMIDKNVLCLSFLHFEIHPICSKQ